MIIKVYADISAPKKEQLKGLIKMAVDSYNMRLYNAVHDCPIEFLPEQVKAENIVVIADPVKKRKK